jgi:hypothetical protein
MVLGRRFLVFYGWVGMVGMVDIDGLGATVRLGVGSSG